jgi:hypothetical protein
MISNQLSPHGHKRVLRGSIEGLQEFQHRFGVNWKENLENAIVYHSNAFGDAYLKMIIERVLFTVGLENLVWHQGTIDEDVATVEAAMIAFNSEKEKLRSRKRQRLMEEQEEAENDR